MTGTSKSKSTQPRSESCWITLYTLFDSYPPLDNLWRSHTSTLHKLPLQSSHSQHFRTSLLPHSRRHSSFSLFHIDAFHSFLTLFQLCVDLRCCLIFSNLLIAIVVVRLLARTPGRPLSVAGKMIMDCTGCPSLFVTRFWWLQFRNATCYHYLPNINMP